MPPLLLITLLVCALGAALLVLRYDLHEREPWWMLLLTAAVAFGAMALLGPIESATLRFLHPQPPWPAWLIAIVAGVQEESARFMLVCVIAILVPRHFNDPMDGIVYGSVAGLGMAVEESVSFLRGDGVSGLLLPGTEYVRLAGHLVLGGIATAGLGFVRVYGARMLPAAVLALGAAVLLHVLWDWLAFDQMLRGRRDWHTPAAAALMVAGFLLYGACVVRAEAASRALFAHADCARSLRGWPFRAGTPRGR